MNLKQQIEADLKKAMLDGNKLEVAVLKGLKNAFLYEEVSQAKKVSGLSEEELTRIIQKEAKKRSESAELYKRGGDEERANTELQEKTIIDRYLPEQLSDVEIQNLVDEAIEGLGGTDKANIGGIIAAVKNRAGLSADGALIAKIAKESLSR